MAVTRSRAVERGEDRRRSRGGNPRNTELLLLVSAAIVFATGLWIAVKAKGTGIADAPTRLNLNELSSKEQLLPYLTFLSSPAERQFYARRIYNAASDSDVGHATSVGRIARIRV